VGSVVLNSSFTSTTILMHNPILDFACLEATKFGYIWRKPHYEHATKVSRLQDLKIGGGQFGLSPVLLESDRYIGDKSIYRRLTICKMTRYRRVKNEKERKESKVQFLYTN
jgi:hypothetical protein